MSACGLAAGDGLPPARPPGLDEGTRTTSREGTPPEPSSQRPPGLGVWERLPAGLGGTRDGVGVPPLLQPSFARRSDEWTAEADAEAEEELRAILDGEYLEPRAANE